MKMILKIDVFASAVADKVTAAPLKKELEARVTKILKESHLGDFDEWSNVVSYKTIDFGTLKATVKFLTEAEAYDSLK